MIKPIQDFVLEFAKDKHFPKVLEVGSRDINGSVKDLINYKEYIGLDLIDDNKSVDVVDDAENIPNHWSSETFDLVICTETLEHVKDPPSIVRKMRNVLKKGGWMLITTPGTGHPEHDWPSDYYRFWENTYKDVFFDGFEEVVTKTLIWDSPGLVDNTRYPHAILGYGKKP
jgi:SAM-dependent methyltransferase